MGACVCSNHPTFRIARLQHLFHRFFSTKASLRLDQGEGGMGNSHTIVAKNKGPSQCGVGSISTSFPLSNEAGRYPCRADGMLRNVSPLSISADVRSYTANNNASEIP